MRVRGYVPKHNDSSTLSFSWNLQGYPGCLHIKSLCVCESVTYLWKILPLMQKTLGQPFGNGSNFNDHMYTIYIPKESIKNNLTEVWQSKILKRLLFYRLLISKPLYKLTITDRQAGRQTDRKSHL